MNKIQIKNCQSVEWTIHDFEIGDYVYFPRWQLGDDGRYHKLMVMGRVSLLNSDRKALGVEYCGAALHDVCLVPLSEEWFVANPKVFAPTDDIQEPKGQTIAWAYQFEARRWPAVYYAVGLRVAYEDADERMRLLDEGLSFLDAKEAASHTSIIVQIVRRIPGSPGSALAVAQVISIHELQHFLRLCGAEELQAPENL